LQQIAHGRGTVVWDAVHLVARALERGDCRRDVALLSTSMWRVTIASRRCCITVGLLSILALLSE
jgi:hypothetical protein